QLVRELEIDIAVDLTGYTAHARTGILAYRPAPVQVNFLGYPGTLGADYVDYLVADRFVVPEDCRRFYAEQVVYLPDTYQPRDDALAIAEPAPSRAEAGLPEHGFVFCCFNSLHKITPPVFAIWMRLLHRVAGSVLWLLEGEPAAMAHLRDHAAAHGVAGERLVFAPRQPIEQHLARHRCADLFLDTLPYNAHTTASDALWAGLPLLTCAAPSGFAGRVAGSLLHAAGLPELVTFSLADYEALARRLADEPQRLRALREKLGRARKAAPLFDTARFCRHLEQAYDTMSQRRQRGEPPAAFAL
ncbi:MAG TPA: glycosyltransferase, partial [Stellaceae bacterium]|nr:glycosyltransferase [Stellaceae bacterium]